MWARGIRGSGVAAIAEDFTTFIALENRQLQAYAPRHDRDGDAILEAQRDVGIKAEWISLIDSQVHLLAPIGGGTRLRVYTRAAKPVYSRTVPIRALQPAIAGASGRVYVAGAGIVALDNGALTWRQDASEPVYASSFEDGSLALATGKHLDFVKPDGTVDQTFTSEEPLVAPPAIAADGSVWVASATALYIAR